MELYRLRKSPLPAPHFMPEVQEGKTHTHFSLVCVPHQDSHPLFASVCVPHPAPCFQTLAGGGRKG